MNGARAGWLTGGKQSRKSCSNRDAFFQADTRSPHRARLPPPLPRRLCAACAGVRRVAVFRGGVFCFPLRPCTAPRALSWRSGLPRKRPARNARHRRAGPLARRAKAPNKWNETCEIPASARPNERRRMGIKMAPRASGSFRAHVEGPPPHGEISRGQRAATNAAAPRTRMHAQPRET